MVYIPCFFPGLHPLAIAVQLGLEIAQGSLTEISQFRSSLQRSYRTTLPLNALPPKGDSMRSLPIPHRTVDNRPITPHPSLSEESRPWP